MSSSSLPADASKDGNVWCEVCGQSLAASRAASHLVSKKHTEAAQRGGNVSPVAAEPKKKSKSSGGGVSPTPTSPAPAESKRRSKTDDDDDASDVAITLPRDPQDSSKYWCGICQVSLGKSQAAKHLTTKSHQTKASTHLTKAMSGARIS